MMKRIFKLTILFALVAVAGTGAGSQERPPEGGSYGLPDGAEQVLSRVGIPAVVAAHAHRHGIQLDALPDSATSAVNPTTELYLRYAEALGHGQIAARSAGIPWEIPGAKFSQKAALALAISGRPEDALDAVAPPHREYWSLVTALARYRSIAAHGGWAELATGPVLEMGDRGPRVFALRQRLLSEGDLAPVDATGEAFDAPLSAAVVRFQARHGLETDGRVGPRTLTELNTPVSQRIVQIVVNMERWRWMPRNLPMPRAEVNIAEAVLRVMEADGMAMEMRVIVGSRRHPTPLLKSAIRAAVVNPPWYVPSSIWRNEILPRLRADPSYLAAHRMRILGRSHDPYGLELNWKNPSDLPQGIRIQQEPGPHNALGRVKFDIPNRFDVYLHDTPTRSAFKRPERALSHGCVRLERPEALYEYLLEGDSTAPSLPAIDGPGPWPSRIVPVRAPLPVFLLYWTAFVGADGAVQFRPDIYGHDARMRVLLSTPGSIIASEWVASGCGGFPSQS